MSLGTHLIGGAGAGSPITGPRDKSGAETLHALEAMFQQGSLPSGLPSEGTPLVPHVGKAKAIPGPTGWPQRWRAREEPEKTSCPSPSCPAGAPRPADG